jgi:hypothetical protein
VSIKTKLPVSFLFLSALPEVFALQDNSQPDEYGLSGWQRSTRRFS